MEEELKIKKRVLEVKNKNQEKLKKSKILKERNHRRIKKELKYYQKQNVTFTFNIKIRTK